MIVELFGLPGSGKTTFVSEFCKIQMDFKNYGTISFIGNSKYNKYKYVFLCFKPKIFLSLFLLIYSISGKKSSIRVKMKDRLISLLYVIYILDIVFYKNEKFILDEGLVQALSAFYIGFDFKENILYIIKKMINRKKYVFCRCNLSFEESLNRMHNRNRKTANIDFMDRNELLKFMTDLSKKNEAIVNIFSEGYSLENIEMYNQNEALTNLVYSIKEKIW